ncbi:hypothetical protein [Streptomyces coeruleorubidus]|uniref:hypothetical protein n=1 Tax=Streptomyces coeruleorubidus TaxID=116188 RepID=UPI0033A3A292
MHKATMRAPHRATGSARPWRRATTAALLAALGLCGSLAAAPSSTAAARSVTGEVINRASDYNLLVWNNARQNMVGAGDHSVWSAWHVDWEFTREYDGTYTIRWDDGQPNPYCLTATASDHPWWGTKTAKVLPCKGESDNQRWYVTSVGVPGRPNVVTIGPVSEDGDMVLSINQLAETKAYSVTLAATRYPDERTAKDQQWTVPRRVVTDGWDR